MKPDLLEMALDALTLAYNCMENVSDDEANTIEPVIVALEAAKLEAQPTAKEIHLMDLYDFLGVRWGDDPFIVIAKLKAQPVGVPAGMKLVPLEFVQGFNTLAHNYSLRAVPPSHYLGIEGTAFSNAYTRCGEDLARLLKMLSSAAPSLPVEEKVQIEPVMGEMDEKTKMVTPYITQEQFDKTFPVDPTAKIEVQGEKK